MEKLVAFHVGIGAGQFHFDEFNIKEEEENVVLPYTDNHENVFNSLQDRYRSLLQSHASKKVPTELLLLEQRLCLEEEKFLLVKLKNEYATKFLKGGIHSGSGSGLGSSVNQSMSSMSTMSSMASSMTNLSNISRSSTPSRPSSVVDKDLRP